jgi:cobalt-zinc-cadmium efflux system outer membrane protein
MAATMGITRTSALAAALLALAGCASLDPMRAFDDVKNLSSQRATGDVIWLSDAGASGAITARVTELLAKELTPESAVQIAFLRNRRMQAALAELGIAQAELVQAGLLPNPVLSADVRFGVGVSGTGADLGLVQEFLSVLQIPLKRRVARAELEATKLDIASALFELSASVRAAFFDAQGADQMLKLRRTVVETTGLAADVALRQHRAGNITDLDLANQRAFYEDAKLALADAEIDAVAKHERLTALLGLWGDEAAWSVAPRLPEVPADELSREGLESRAVATRLDLAAARQRIGVSAASVAFTRFYGLIPEASAGVVSEREVESGDWSVGPSIEIPIPILDQRQARLAIARARQQQSEESFAALAVEIRSDVRRAWTELDAARSRATYYERVLLPLRRRILQETQREYNAMLVGVYQLLQTKRDEVEAGRAYVDAIRGYWLSRVALERALGTELALGPPSSAGAPIEPAQPTAHEHDEHGSHQ